MSPYNFKRLHQKITKQKIKLLVKRFVIVIVCCFLLFLAFNFIFPLHDRVEFSTIVTDAKGDVVNAFLTSDDKWRMKTELKEISPLLRKTIIAKEDKHFYRHPGVNVFAVSRAFFKNLLQMKRTSGASTITMQVARALEPRKRTLFS
jgi:penicillin-binding protein 1C